MAGWHTRRPPGPWSSAGPPGPLGVISRVGQRGQAHGCPTAATTMCGEAGLHRGWSRRHRRNEQDAPPSGHPRASRRDAAWTTRPPAVRGRRARRPRVRHFRRLARADGSPSGDAPGASAARNADRTRDTGVPAWFPGRRRRAAEQFASAFGQSRLARACDGPPRRGLRKCASGRFAQGAAARSPVWRTSLTASSLAIPLIVPEHATAPTATYATNRPSGRSEHRAAPMSGAPTLANLVARRLCAITSLSRRNANVVWLVILISREARLNTAKTGGRAPADRFRAQL